MSNEKKDWSSSEMFVINKLSEHSVMLAAIQDKMVNMQIETNALKIKFAIATAIGITLATIVPPIVSWGLKLVQTAAKNPNINIFGP
jgi:hypothetical protein